MIRKVTFGDLVDDQVLFLVVELIRAATGPAVKDSDLSRMLATGELEAFWVFNESGHHAGLISAQCGPDEATGLRSFHIASATIAPHVNDGGWMRLLAYGRMLAVERGCRIMQFEIEPQNKRMQDLAWLFGAKASPAPDGLTRYTLEVI